jgi:hypothetical protein
LNAYEEIELFVTCVSYTCMLWLVKLAFLGYFSNLRGILTRKARRFFVFVCAYTGISFMAALTFQLGFCAPIQRNWYEAPHIIEPSSPLINVIGPLTLVLNALIFEDYPLSYFRQA